MNPSARAFPFAQAKMFHVFVSMAATRTQLSRSEGLADLHDGLPVPARLVLQNAEEL